MFPFVALVGYSFFRSYVKVSGIGRVVRRNSPLDNSLGRSTAAMEVNGRESSGERKCISMEMVNNEPNHKVCYPNANNRAV